MPAAPRVASASPPESAAGARGRFPAARRLLRPEQFAAVISEPNALRASGRWLSLAGRLRSTAADVPVRFGFTASKRQAPLAVDRNTVRRVLRESARRHLAELDAAAGSCGIDVVLRLKAAARGAAMPRRAWKAALRADAEQLLLQLAGRLRALAAER
jgi:ribonuclease P protein component